MEATIEITTDQIHEIAYDAEIYITVHADYSGRGMYGASCFGISGSRADLREFLMHLAFTAGVAQGRGYQDSPERDLYEELKAYGHQSDNMAFDEIWYWPNVKVINSDLAE